jgi:hypothetical protein
MRLHSDQTCTQCGKRLDPAEAVWLEMDSETHLYHAYGDPVPPGALPGRLPLRQGVRPRHREARGAPDPPPRRALPLLDWHRSSIYLQASGAMGPRESEER